MLGGVGGVSEGLTRLTVNLIPKAYAALSEAAELEGVSRTDALNRALQMYTYLLRMRSAGDRLFVGRNGKSLDEVIWDCPGGADGGDRELTHENGWYEHRGAE